ncbi:hypothetical protein [Actinoplanes rectilineatus]|uniref:hypothetical protein n=1 Tax=Actinoplanes rectilineatus TaxID=113571 RepID=UPI0012FC6A3C|nr:hypothetical protein [Actinoplanes rectilineatus]
MSGLRRFGRSVRTLWISAIFATIAAMLGAWLGWQQAGDLPTDDGMRSLAATVAPGVPVAEVNRADHISGLQYWFDDDEYYEFAGSDEWGAGYTEAVYDQPIADLAPLRDRLAAAGWEVGEVHSPGYGWRELTAASGDWRLRVTGTSTYTPASLWVERAEPLGALILSFVFAALGAALGWSAATRLATGGVGLLGGVGFGLLTLNMIAVLGTLIGNVIDYAGTGLPVLPWEFFATIMWRPLTMLGMLLTAAWLVSATADRRRAMAETGPETA